MQVGTIKKGLHCTAGIFQNHLFKVFYLLSHNSICLFFEKHFCLFNLDQFNVLKLCLKKTDIRK